MMKAKNGHAVPPNVGTSPASNMIEVSGWMMMT
jgi:hypothetical protein